MYTLRKDWAMAVVTGVAIGCFAGFYSSVLALLLLFLTAGYLVITKKVEKYLILGILSSLFLFSVILGVDTFVYLTIDRIGIILLIVFYFLTHRKHEKLSGFEKLYLTFTFSIVISTLVITTINGLDTMNSIKKLVLMFGEYFLFFYVLKRLLVKYDSRKILKYVLFLGFAVGVFGINEYLTQKNILFDFVLANNLPYNQFYEKTFLWGQIRGDMMRAKATFSHALEFAGILSLLLPFALYFLFETKRFWKKVVLWILIGVIVSTAVVSIARSLILVDLFIIFLFIMLSRSVSVVKKLFLAMGSIAVSLIMLITLFDFFFPQGVGNDLSFQARAENLQGGIALISQNPFFGLGYGNIPSDQVFDNYYYSLVVQSGFMGLILFMVAFAYLFITYANKTVKAKDKSLSNFYLTMSLFVVVFLLLNLAYDALGFITVGKLFFLLLAVGVSMETKFNKKV